MNDKKPHLLYVAFGFPPASKSCTYRMLATANHFAANGWKVTVFNQPDETWLMDSGLDQSLLDMVDESITQIQLNVSRDELATDIRTFSELRAKSPSEWLEKYLDSTEVDFPERRYGHWSDEIRRATAELHSKNPVDLVIASVQPYVQLVANEYLDALGIPSVIDFRDAWSLNPISGEINFPTTSRAGQFEEKLITSALEIWVVNDRIASFYRERFPNQESKIRVIRNGFDPESIPSALRKKENKDFLNFGYIGVLGVELSHLEAILEGWTIARTRQDFKSARLTFRGHIGAGYQRMNNPRLHLINSHFDQGVEYLGPIPRSQVLSQYLEWDALLFAVQGGSFVTSAKIYEYLATGLPIVSSHTPDHGALEVSKAYPRNFVARSFKPIDIAEAFWAAADNTKKTVAEENELREDARSAISEFARDKIVSKVVSDLIARVENLG